MSHTSGPWEIRKRDAIGFHNAYVILNERFGDENRDLISAAPDMLDLLHEIYIELTLQGDNLDHELFSKLTRVINKATGVK